MQSLNSCSSQTILFWVLTGGRRWCSATCPGWVERTISWASPTSWSVPCVWSCPWSCSSSTPSSSSQETTECVHSLLLHNSSLLNMLPPFSFVSPSENQGSGQMGQIYFVTGILLFWISLLYCAEFNARAFNLIAKISDFVEIRSLFVIFYKCNIFKCLKWGIWVQSCYH